MQEKLASHEWNLYEYQVNFLKMQSLKKYRQILITSEVGTGKTITAFLPFFKSAIDKIKKKVIYVSPLKSINTTLHERLLELSSFLGINCKIEKEPVMSPILQKKNNFLKFQIYFLHLNH